MRRRETDTTIHADVSESSKDSGMALFIVLVLVLVLTVVITQMVFVTQIEKRISKNRQGFTHLNYALQASSRMVLQKISEDLMDDLGLLDVVDPEEELGMGTLPGSGIDEPTAPGGGGPGNDSGDGEDPARSNDPVDTRHDVWAYPLQDTINEVQVSGEIIDGESCIDLNHIFELVLFEEDDEDEEDGLEGSDGVAQDLEDLGVPGTAGSALPTGDSGEEFLDGEFEEEYVLPEQQQVDDAEYMLQRLIEAVIDFNQENGFAYNQTPDPVDAAGAIVGYVFQRVSDEKTRRIRSLDSLLHLEEISLELFDGPLDPMDEELLTESLDDQDSSGLSGGLGIQDLPGIGSLDFLQQSGYSLLDDMVESPISPIGLRHVMTANSSGKINLNTARPEVIIALIPSIEDFVEAKEIAWQIYERGDTFKELSEDEEALAAEMAPDDDEDPAQEFEHFTNINQLSQINEDWTVGDMGDESIADLLKQDLGSNVVFASQYFTANLEGTRENQTLAGKLVCARRDRHIVVLSWRELKR